MNYNIENSKSRKKRHEKKSIHCLHSMVTDNNSQLAKRFNKSGFVAWPKSKLPIVREHADGEISAGRSKDGGYIAYPKK